MPDSSTHAAPEPSPEPDCTCTHITGDAYCPRHGEDAEPCPTPAEMTQDQREADPTEQDRYGIPTHGPGLPVEPEKQAPTRVGAREESSASHPTPEQWEALRRDIAAAINRNSAESWFNDTPDRVLAAYAVDALSSFGVWSRAREQMQDPGSMQYEAGWRAGHEAGIAETMRPIGERPADLSGPAPGGN